MSYIKNQELFIKNLRFYIYIHYTKDNIPFYVGKGQKVRCLDSKNRSNWWYSIVEKYGYYVVIKEINLNEEECFEREVFWINYYGRKDLKQGTLVNLTNGGEGVSGRIYSKEEKEKKSKFFRENLELLQSYGKRGKFFGEILTGKNNPNYGNIKGNNPLAKAVVKLTLQGDYICEYSSLREAEEDNNVKGVYQVCKGKRHQLKGFIYVYKEDYEKGNYKITKGITSKKTVFKIDLKTGKILKKYNSINSTEIDGFSPKNVSQVCTGEKKSHKKFFWRQE